MLTSDRCGNPRQSWARRLWPFPVVGVHGTENPRVGGSTPSQATNLQRLSGISLRRLALHFEHAAGGLLFLAPLLLPTCTSAEATPADPWEPVPHTEGRLRAAAADAAWIAGAGAVDLWTTQHALSRCSSCYEGTPWMRGSLPARVGLKLAMTGAGVAWADHLRRKGDRRGARLVRWGLVGLQVGFAAWNLRQAR